MERKPAIPFITIYEAFKALLIIKMSVLDFSSQDSALLPTSLPAAYFLGVPLLVIPFIILLGITFKNEKLSACAVLIPIIKLISVIGTIGYIILNAKQVLLKMRMGNFILLSNIIFLVIFLIIDVIIGIVFFIEEKRGNSKTPNENIESGEVICK